ncbi:hypothetical protein DIPPA_27197 [Diplonema papillatum]|nr:hypothetical protein DIPPA_27197 [Diplonema papillatum]
MPLPPRAYSGSVMDAYADDSAANELLLQPVLTEEYLRAEMLKRRRGWGERSGSQAAPWAPPHARSGSGNSAASTAFAMSEADDSLLSGYLYDGPPTRSQSAASGAASCCARPARQQRKEDDKHSPGPGIVQPFSCPRLAEFADRFTNFLALAGEKKEVSIFTH